jgi:hypothetical protein
MPLTRELVSSPRESYARRGTTMQLPPCGLYRTGGAIGNIPAGRLVYFHNHGDPGPAVYLPTGWKRNRAQWRPSGVTVDDGALVATLEPLPPEGFYRVIEAFHCCDKQCRRFEVEALLELGYNAEAQPIVFTPELVDGMLAIPQTGSAIDSTRLSKLKQLRVATASRDARDVH